VSCARETEFLHAADPARSLTYNASPLILAFPIYRVALRLGVRLMAQAATPRLKALSAECAILGLAGLARERWRASGCPPKLRVDIGGRHD
jgi:hypothetical protein